MDRRRQNTRSFEKIAGGIDPLPDRYDYLASINNKAVEYLSAGLPVVSSPRHGVLYELLEREECGLVTRPVMRPVSHVF